MGTGRLENEVQVSYHEYDFARDGGVVGNIALRGNYIPKGAIIMDGLIDVETAITSGGSATCALQLEAANDILAATGKASFTLDAKLDVVPVGTAATSVRTTDKKKVVMVVAAAALTAGKITVALRYIMPRG